MGRQGPVQDRSSQVVWPEACAHRHALLGILSRFDRVFIEFFITYQLEN